MGKRNAENDIYQNQNNFYSPPVKKGRHDFSTTNGHIVVNLSPNLSPNVDDQEFALTKELVDGTILTDICQNKWRVGKPVGKGSFGEIFLASNDIKKPVTSENAKYVVKIEPHSSGPLFVEIHCLLNTGKSTVDAPLPPGIPEYIASGSHVFKQSKYRFLILPRYKFDLHSIIKNRRIDQKNLLVIASEILEILEHFHDKGYAHSDIKAENLMIGSCTYVKKKYETNKQIIKTPTPTTNGKKILSFSLNRHIPIADKRNKRKIKYNSSSDGNNDNDNDNDDEDENDEDNNESEYETNVSENSEFEEDDEKDESIASYEQKKKQINKTTGRNSILKSRRTGGVCGTTTNTSAASSTIEFSGSNPVRSCRMLRKNSTYADMLSSHYLRPSRKINYRVDDSEDDDCNNKDDDEDFKIKTSKLLLSPTKKLHESSSIIDLTSSISKKPIEHQQQTIVYDLTTPKQQAPPPPIQVITEDRIFLIDFGLAIKFIDSNGSHRPFVMDQRRAHDGTLEFTSRDAHMGAHSRRSDLECLGYNLIYWSQGSLPWKCDKIMSQPEHVHRMKEYLMTDVKELLKQIYGKLIPKYLGEFMEYVNSLAYHDRPDYDRCKRLFMSELLKLGIDRPEQCRLNIDELKKQSKKVEICDEMSAGGLMDPSAANKLKDVQSLMRLGIMIPSSFKENGTNRISPKNLRSKSEKIPKKQRKHFSWTEILSTDPDQIARKRAEKEFERDATETPIQARYTGKPTYAILEVQRRLKFKEKLDRGILDDSSLGIQSLQTNNGGSDGGGGGGGNGNDDITQSNMKNGNNQNNQCHQQQHQHQHQHQSNNDSKIKKSIGSIHQTLQSQILNTTKKLKKNLSNSNMGTQSTPLISSTPANNSISKQILKRRKSGLRNYLRPTEKSLLYQDNEQTRQRRRLRRQQQQKQRQQRKNLRKRNQNQNSTVKSVNGSVRDNHNGNDDDGDDDDDDADDDVDDDNDEDGDVDNFTNSEESCSSSAATESSSVSENITTNNNTSSDDNNSATEEQNHTNKTGNNNSRRYNSSCGGLSSPASEEDSRDTTDYNPNPTRRRRNRPKTVSINCNKSNTQRRKILNRKRTGNSSTSVVSGRVNNKVIQTKAAVAANIRNELNNSIRAFIRG